jgi:hypothetical protein
MVKDGCPYGWETSEKSDAIMEYTGSKKLNEFIGSPGGLQVLQSCKCDEIFVGEKKRVDPCNLPDCMKGLPLSVGACNTETKKEKKTVKKLNPTQYGSESETAVVRAFIKYMKDISNNKLYIKGDEKSEEKYDDYIMGDITDLDELIRPETKSYKDLYEKAQILKDELSKKKIKK